MGVLSDFILAWGGGGMVLRIRGFHQQRFNSIISRFFPAGRGHMMNLERCPVAIPLQASRAPRTDPPIVSVIPSNPNISKRATLTFCVSQKRKFPGSQGEILDTLR